MALKTLRANAVVFFMLAFASGEMFAQQVSGLAQLSWVKSDEQVSFLERDSGQFRFGDDDGLTLSQTALSLEWDLAADVNLVVNGFSYWDHNRKLGISEAFALYKPLSSRSWKFSAKGGIYFPTFGFSQVDKAWLNPFNFSFSAIDSWMAEELRANGLELGWRRPGRVNRSPHSVELKAGVFKGNDPLGTLLAWRGWSIQDRITLYNERVLFAPYSTLTLAGPDTGQPAWVEPFQEIDGRFGYYLGGHWDYFKTFQTRVYWYDNNGDPMQVNEDNQQYAWDTQFASVAVKYKVHKKLQLLAHYLQGNTRMGPGFIDLDFRTWYWLMSYQWQQHQFNIRRDVFDNQEKDNVPQDWNDSHGSGWSLGWRMKLSSHWQLGLEWNHLNTWTESRLALLQVPRQHQRQLIGHIQFRF